jgi:hypothetical protein
MGVEEAIEGFIEICNLLFVDASFDPGLAFHQTRDRDKRPIGSERHGRLTTASYGGARHHL